MFVLTSSHDIAQNFRMCCFYYVFFLTPILSWTSWRKSFQSSIAKYWTSAIVFLWVSQLHNTFNFSITYKHVFSVSCYLNEVQGVYDVFIAFCVSIFWNDVFVQSFQNIFFTYVYVSKINIHIFSTIRFDDEIVGVGPIGTWSYLRIHKKGHKFEFFSRVIQSSKNNIFWIFWMVPIFSQWLYREFFPRFCELIHYFSYHSFSRPRWLYRFAFDISRLIFMMMIQFPGENTHLIEVSATTEKKINIESSNWSHDWHI